MFPLSTSLNFTPQDETWTDFDGPLWIEYDLFRKNKLPGSKNVNLAKFMLRAILTDNVFFKLTKCGFKTNADLRQNLFLYFVLGSKLCGVTFKNTSLLSLCFSVL